MSGVRTHCFFRLSSADGSSDIAETELLGSVSQWDSGWMVSTMGAGVPSAEAEAFGALPLLAARPDTFLPARRFTTIFLKRTGSAQKRVCEECKLVLHRAFQRRNGLHSAYSADAARHTNDYTTHACTLYGGTDAHLSSDVRCRAGPFDRRALRPLLAH